MISYKLKPEKDILSTIPVQPKLGFQILVVPAEPEPNNGFYQNLIKKEFDREQISIQFSGKWSIHSGRPVSKNNI